MLTTHTVTRPRSHIPTRPHSTPGARDATAGARPLPKSARVPDSAAGLVYPRHPTPTTAREADVVVRHRGGGEQQLRLRPGGDDLGGVENCGQGGAAPTATEDLAAENARCVEDVCLIARGHRLICRFVDDVNTPAGTEEDGELSPVPESPQAGAQAQTEGAVGVARRRTLPSGKTSSNGNISADEKQRARVLRKAKRTSSHQPKKAEPVTP